jgi:hypothetical protein
MKVKISSIFPITPLKLFEDLQNPQILIKAASPVITYIPIDPDTMPIKWEAGNDYLVKLRLFKIIPVGLHRIGIVYFNEETLEAMSDESGTIATVWTHHMTLKAYGQDATLYTDEIEIKAGFRTVFVWLFANYFYRHRQRKWKAIARTGL